jgi:hypothetical protein
MTRGFLESFHELMYGKAVIDRETALWLEKKIDGNFELQSFLVELLERMQERFDLAERILCDTNKPAAKKHVEALTALGFRTSKRHKIPQNLFPEYWNIIAMGGVTPSIEMQRQAVQTLVDRHGLHSYEATCRELNRQYHTYYKHWLKGIKPPHCW